jgi:molybdopterin-guanine dinucleotide biosynthesis protein MobB
VSGFRFGIDRLLEDSSALSGRRVALLSHPAGVTSSLEPSWQALSKAPGVRLVKLFGPEHGIDGSAQDMIQVSDWLHRGSGLPARSLYGATFSSLSPSAADLADVDLLVCDLQDVGSRYYTFVWTICLAIEACARRGVEVVVCDRPNPLGERREGEPQKLEGLSFVGLHPVPVRHGRTIGELAEIFARDRDLPRPRVVRMKQWARHDGWPSGAFFLPPSPNMPTLDTAAVYPGACLVEATNLSEGRGTTRPFEQVGAPYLGARKLAAAMNERGLPGVRFFPTHFRPTFQKFAGEVCHGVFWRVDDAATFRPYETGLRLLETVRSLWPADFRWRAEPYEFESRPAIDLLTGSSEFRQRLDAGENLEDFYARQESPQPDPVSFYAERRPALLGVAGDHDSGKTTLLERLVPQLRARGWKVGAVKHTPHDVEDDVPGKDSFRHRAAGAEPAAFLRPSSATLRRNGGESLDVWIEREFGDCEIVLVEGFHAVPIDRIEVGRARTRSVEFGGREFGEDLAALGEAIARHFGLDP